MRHLARNQFRREEKEQEMTLEKKWRELALQFDCHRMQAMALIRAVASGTANNKDCAEFAAAPPQQDGTTSNKYRAELYDEVWGKAREMGYANVTMALCDLLEIKAQLANQKPVARLTAERVWGNAGEYWLGFTNNDWLDQCRKTGGEFYLYPQLDAGAKVRL